MGYIAHYRKSDQQEQSVTEHLLGVAEIAKQFSSKIGLPNCGELIGLLHDMGKYSDEFQHYICSAIGKIDPSAEGFVDARGKKGKIDHSTAGGQLIGGFGCDLKGFSYLQQVLSQAVLGHHGGLIDCISPDGIDKYSQRLSKDTSKTHLEEVSEICPDKVKDSILEILSSKAILDEFLVVLKKIPRGSQHIFLGFLCRYLLSCLLDADRLDTADFENPENKKIRLYTRYPEWGEFIDALETRLRKFSIENRVDEIRNDVSESCRQSGRREKGVYTLTVPTGGGKTLAGLRFALEHAAKHLLDRVIFVIPYTSIIDQNAREVQKVFADLSNTYGVELVLEHHSNLIPEKETKAQRLMAENWDAPVVYTTLVQFLDALFDGGTRGARRMHNLANAVVVFDEVQTLPVKAVHLFNNAMNFLVKVCSSSVVLCTATQPLLHTVDKTKGAIELLPHSEIMVDVSALFEDLQRVEVIDQRKVEGYSDEHIAELIQHELAITGSVLTIVNTKKSAENLYKLCREYDAEVYHLSTNQCPQHRLELIDQIRELARPASTVPIICISTQLIEAGVDVDFGSVIRFVAGLDSIAQAAGRCNRSGKRAQKGRVLLVNPVREHISMLTDITIGKEKCERVLAEYEKNSDQFDHSLIGPKAMRRYFDYYFYARSGEMGYPVSSEIHVQEDSLIEMLGANQKAVDVYKRAHNHPPSLHLRQSFATAGRLFSVIDSKTQGVVVPFGEGKDIIAALCASEDITQEKALLKRAQRYSVNCYEQLLQRLNSAGALHNIGGSGIYCLQEQYYSREFGVSVTPVLENIKNADYCV